MEFNEIINGKILKVWEDYQKESGDYLPILYPPFKRDGILFIGLNPSFNKTFFEKKLGKDYKKELGKKSKNITLIIQLESDAIKDDGYSFFKKFHKISKELGIPFQHIDLFYFRDTNQDNTKDRIGIGKKKNVPTKLNNFALGQLKIAIEMIVEINPQIIIVANAFASDIITNCDLFKINNDNFEKEGYDILEIEKQKIPIIFSSMLTGQRALDTHTFRRLKWHIKRIINR